MNVNTLESLSSTDRIAQLLTDRKVPVPADKHDALILLVKSSGVRSQEEYAGLAIALTKGTISGDDLTQVVKEGFPQSKAGKRHGPYYLSHARTGKLVVPEDSIPGKGVRRTTITTAQVEVKVVDPALQAKIDELEAQIALIREAKSLKDVKAVLASTETNEG